MTGPSLTEWMRNERGYAPRTQDAVTSTCSLAERYLQTTYGVRLIRASRDQLLGYLATFASARTRNAYLTRLGIYFRWAAQTERRKDVPTATIEALREPRRLPRPIGKSEAVRLLRSCDGEAEVVVALGLYAGLRISEIAALSWADVDMNDSTIRIVNGKGSKERLVPMAPALGRVLRRHRLSCPPGPWLFPSPRGHKQANTLRGYVIAAAKLAGVDARPHRLRHTCATELLRGGTDLRRVQAVLGHASVATTQTYTEVVVEDLIGDVGRLNFG